MSQVRRVSFLPPSPVSAEPRGRSSERARVVPVLLSLWALAGVLLFTALGEPSVNRTQEARVLETAREMLGAPLHQWLIPQVNGHVRMQKPPLAYWLTAAAFRVFGVSEAAGRAPAALAAWGTLGLVLLIARRLFTNAAAGFAAAALLGSVLFGRFARLAETDTLGMCFVTAAVYALMRAFFFDDALRPSRRALWCHVAAAAIAMGVLVKGPIAGYPLLFLLAMAAVERRWRVLGQFVVSGAPLTLLLLAAPWFAYVATRPEMAILAEDLHNSVRGGKGHWDLPHVYASYFFVGAMPWTLPIIAAVAFAVRRSRRDRGLRMVMAWAAVILVPLLFWGNKQRHYLLPLMPPTMILLGWFLDRVTARPRSPRLWKLSAGLTWLACLAGGLLLPLLGKLGRGQSAPVDWALGVLIVALCLVVRSIPRRAATLAFAATSVLLTWFGSTYWTTTLQPSGTASVSRSIADRFGDRPLAFVRNERLAIVWDLKRIIPVVADGDELQALARRTPGLVAIQPVTRGNPQSRVIEPAISVRDADDAWFVIGPVIPSASR